jgi:hypothetical protein
MFYVHQTAVPMLDDTGKPLDEVWGTYRYRALEPDDVYSGNQRLALDDLVSKSKRPPDFVYDRLSSFDHVIHISRADTGRWIGLLFIDPTFSTGQFCARTTHKKTYHKVLQRIRPFLKHYVSTRQYLHGLTV